MEDLARRKLLKQVLAKKGVAMKRHHVHGRRARFKFYSGDRVVGNDKRADYREYQGTVVKYGPGKGEYLVRFDDGREEYINTEWLDRLENK